MQLKDLKDRLYAIAQSQEGLFTAQQAQKAGFDKRHHSYHGSVA